MFRCVWIRVWSPHPYSHHRDPSVDPALCTAIPRIRVRTRCSATSLAVSVLPAAYNAPFHLHLGVLPTLLDSTQILLLPEALAAQTLGFKFLEPRIRVVIHLGPSQSASQILARRH